uniref:NADH-ubiquinone oxidoreductase chain 4L n=2 Tax=Symphurus TaxID=195651 RepID=A0AA51X361_9PLEU|nr:NADH dehydrogenase subunit 4L [Symphurus plagiusa]AFC88385.1 NADH dehydrogenase subunit 4L [Symphurus plagiusa]WMY90144.1 NADH dehydrogenase subunit 4L [Symphurus plagiusa]WMY90157.1 NADH dehydrogenase subunit 4L [Symphurus sp.]
MLPSQFAFSSALLLALTGLTLHRQHLLSALLCLEAIMLSLFVGLSLWALQFNTPMFSAAPLLALAFSACEAGAGLALLVATARMHGSDLLQNLSLLQC